MLYLFVFIFSVFFPFFFFFNDTATTEIYTLSLHDALPIAPVGRGPGPRRRLARPPTKKQAPPAMALRACARIKDVRVRSDSRATDAGSASGRDVTPSPLPAKRTVGRQPLRPSGG